MRNLETAGRHRVFPVCLTAAAALLSCSVLCPTASAVEPAPDAKPIDRLVRLSVGPPDGVGMLTASACVMAEIPCNTTVTGQLTLDDCPLGDETFYDSWTFQGTAGQHVEINMAAAYDTYLYLYNPAGMEVAEDDDSGGGANGTNSKISFDIGVTGTWTIRANSYQTDFGPYSLDLRCSSVEPPPPPPTCVVNATELCLNNGRFLVSVTWRVPSQGTSGLGTALPLTSDTGYFWFFSANNIELVIKVVDGRGFNGYFWVFYGALSDVEYTISVTDTVTRAVKIYRNTAGHLASVADVVAFPGGAAAGTSASMSTSTGSTLTDFARNQSSSVHRLVTHSASAACVPDATTLCLNGGRFQVRVIFSAPSLEISNAPAHAIPLTADTGYFWFFSGNNVELVLKAVDGRAFNGYFWVFYGALSDVEYTITVTDSLTGAVKTYVNPPGQLASVADVAAF